MKTAFALSASLAYLAATFAAPLAKGDDGYIGNSTSSHDSTDGKEYVVLFNSSHPVTPEVHDVLQRVQLSADHQDVRYTFNNSVFKGFVATMGSHCTDALNAMVDVSHVEEAVSIKSFATSTRTGATWGLQRISSASGASGDAKAQDFTYSYTDSSLGKGVDIYVVDTGVRTSHAAFGGRATTLWSFNGNSTDGDGHGTHVAGTAASSTFGVASGANIFAVKVLGDDGSGSSADTIKGMDQVITNHEARSAKDGFVGTVMSMSWGLSGISTAVDQAIMAANSAGIHISVAAGNDGTDACNSTPSHNSANNTGSVITVGSMNIENTISTFSNTGSCVSIYAPGEDVLSTWNTGDNVIQYLSGTSMATPHVTGVMAYLMAADTTGKLAGNVTALKEALLSTARTSAISGTTDSGDAKILLSNGVNGAVSRLTKNWVVPDGDNGLTSAPVVARTGSLAARAKEYLGLDRRWDVAPAAEWIRF